jgi:hypothetical protein
MARTITVSPVIPSDGGSYELLARSIQASQEAKRKREQATYDAIIEQQKANQLLFGDTSKELRKLYNDASSVPTQIRDEKLAQAMQKVKAAIGSPNQFEITQDSITELTTTLNQYNNFYKGTKEAIDALTPEGIKPEVVAAFVNKTVFDEFTDQRGKVMSRKLRDVSDIEDPKSFVLKEVATNPELYYAEELLAPKAAEELLKITQRDPLVKDDLSYDPTGKKVVKLGYQYKLSPFEREEERVDDVTKLKYKVPVLDTKPTDVTKPGSDQVYEGLDIVKYNNLQSSLGPASKKKILIGAINLIRKHNEDVLREAGHPDPEKGALSLSQNNIASNMQKMPELINPYEESNIDTFSRIYMPSFIKGIKAYDEKGQGKGFELNRGVDVPKPSVTNINVNTAPVTSEQSKIYHPTTIIEGIKTDRGGFRGAMIKEGDVEGYDVTESFTAYKPVSYGGSKFSYSTVIYSPKDDKFYFRTGKTGALKNQTPDQFASSIIQAAPDIGAKPDPKVFRSLPEAEPAKSRKVITRKEWDNMPLSERPAFINSGGTVK